VLPLFPGYISYCAEQGGERDVYSTGRVVNLVEVRHQKRFMDELEQIYYTLDLGMALQPADPSELLSPGMVVEVHSGPLRGLRGTIVHVKGSSRLILSVEGLGKAVLTIDAGTVRPVEQ
jgi:transcription antitermination factor NusG